MFKQKVNSLKKRQYKLSEVVLLTIMFLLIGLVIGGFVNEKVVIKETQKIDDKNLQEFIDNYNYVLNNYYEVVDKNKLINGAINGMMEALDDPYSVYINEEENDTFSATLDGSYKGIGIQIYKLEDDGSILVAAVFKNSPAFEAGIKIGDKIISIDGKDTTKMTAAEFSSYVRDSKDQSFKIVVIRENETLELNLSKNIVTLDSVSSEIYDIEDKKVGYIYIGIFANNTYGQFKKELQDLEKNNIDTLIIDVRGNTGGHLTSVDSILDIFLTSKQIMYQFKQGENVSPIYGTGNETKKYSIVFLSDENSASASELLIGGLKENLNSIQIGKKTYGKGTVQELVNLKDGTQYKITTKKWLTPKGNWVNDTSGIVPDIEVDLSTRYYETYQEEDDTQLQRAFEYIKTGK